MLTTAIPANDLLLYTLHST